MKEQVDAHKDSGFIFGKESGKVCTEVLRSPDLNKLLPEVPHYGSDTSVEIGESSETDLSQSSTIGSIEDSQVFVAPTTSYEILKSPLSDPCHLPDAQLCHLHRGSRSLGDLEYINNEVGNINSTPKRAGPKTASSRFDEEGMIMYPVAVAPKFTVNATPKHGGKGKERDV